MQVKLNLMAIIKIKSLLEQEMEKLNSSVNHVYRNASSDDSDAPAFMRTSENKMDSKTFSEREYELCQDARTVILELINSIDISLGVEAKNSGYISRTEVKNLLGGKDE